VAAADQFLIAAGTCQVGLRAFVINTAESHDAIFIAHTVITNIAEGVVVIGRIET
jgi:hypothetical protein